MMPESHKELLYEKLDDSIASFFQQLSESFNADIAKMRFVLESNQQELEKIKNGDPLEIQKKAASQEDMATVQNKLKESAQDNEKFKDYVVDILNSIKESSPARISRKSSSCVSYINPPYST